MLYFSETGWTLPDMAEVSAKFDRDYDQDEYEQKIVGLIRKIEADDHAHNQEEKEDWDRAIEKLSEGDHYLQVMIDPSFSPAGRAVRPPHDILKLWLTAFGIVLGLFAFVALGNWLFGSRFWAVTGWIFDRNRLGLLVLFALLIWVLRAYLRDLLNALLNRK